MPMNTAVQFCVSLPGHVMSTQQNPHRCDQDLSEARQGSITDSDESVTDQHQTPPLLPDFQSITLIPPQGLRLRHCPVNISHVHE